MPACPFHHQLNRKRLPLCARTYPPRICGCGIPVRRAGSGIAGLKILLDMNFSLRWVSWLADRNIGAVHRSAVGRPDAPDSQILEYATMNNLIVLTHDPDSGFLFARSGLSSPSVIQTRLPDTSPESAGEQLPMAIRQFSPELTAGCLITLSENRQRIRMLNLKEPGSS